LLAVGANDGGCLLSALEVRLRLELSQQILYVRRAMRTWFGVTACLAAGIICGCRSSVDELQVQSAFAIQNGLDFVAASQTATGGFITDCWHDNTPEQKTPVDAVFTASQVLYSLSFCRESASARGSEERAAKYLIAQQKAPGVWSYYGQGTDIVISPDVDDTSVSWAALQRFGAKIPPAALDAVRASRNERGLFATWIGDPSHWVNIDSRDIDTVVNLNALLLFGLANEKIDGVCKFEIEQVESDAFRRGTVYYRSPLMFAHAFSRAFREGDVTCLQSAVPKIRDTVLSLQNKDGSWGNDLETAFGAVTLLNLGYHGDALERAIKVILARQSDDGGWALAPAYRGAVAPLNYGARAVTAAVCIEALAKYRAQQ
jgi:Prenyltransferase and squalene oxidase repeat